jgi:hypothetical protein
LASCAKRELRRLLDEIGAHHRGGDLRGEFELCRQALPYLRPYIKEDLHRIFEVGAVIELLARCYAATIDPQGVEWICELIYAGDPTLAFGAFVAERAVRELEIASKIFELVNTYAGITQFAAREKLEISKSDMANVLHYMEALGCIRRTPTARTNRLYPGSSSLEVQG